MADQILDWKNFPAVVFDFLVETHARQTVLAKQMVLLTPALSKNRLTYKEIEETFQEQFDAEKKALVSSFVSRLW